MIRSAAGKIMWVGRATVFLVGLAVILALLFGVASTAFAHGGDKGFFHLGHRNVKHAVSKLVGRVAGPSLVIGNGSEDPRATALRLNVKPGKAPMQVSSDAKVARLNADQLDGKDASAIGVNGYERIRVQSAFDSTTHKGLNARCTSGREVIGGGAYVFPSLADGSRDSAPIAIRANSPDLNGGELWRAEANEVEPYSFNWTLYAIVICAKVEP